MIDKERRSELADFLRTRRARLSPADVGLPQTARRKTMGLRREEVAQLASVGVTWYTWLEQGRDISVSTQVLESLAQALRLSSEETTYLFSLAHPAAPLQQTQLSEKDRPFLQLFLRHMGNCPAYVLGPCGAILAWNRAACQVLGDIEALPQEQRNIVYLVFTDAELRRRVVDWEGIAQRILAQFRAESGQYSADPRVGAMIEQLHRLSPEFALWWPRHEIQGRRDGRKEFLLPSVGQLLLEHSTFQVTDAPNLKVAVYLPASEEMARKLALLEEEAGMVGMQGGV